MGILPNKEDGITPGLLFTVSYPPGTTYDLADAGTFGGLTDRLGWRGQDNVVAFLKERVKQFEEWTGATADVWSGMRRGLPGGDGVPLPLAIIEQIASQILGLPPGTWATVNDAIAAIEAIPGVKQIIDLITQAPGVIADYETTLATWGANLHSFFAGIDLLDPALNLVTALESWVASQITPHIASIAAGIITGILPAGLIPGLDASKITSGTFVQSLVPALTSGWGKTIASGLLSGVLGTGLIPALDASKITTGVFGTGFIPNLDAAKITTGTFVASLIPALSALTGILTAGQIPGLDASKITTGAFVTSLIPALDAAKIATGTFADSFLPGLGTLRDNIAQSMIGGVTTGYTAAQVKAALLTIPGGNIASAIAAAIVPALDASKITTGVFGTGFIPNLAASKITSGTFAQSLIPSLSAVGGYAGSIASSLLTGALAQAIIPSLSTAGGYTGTIGSNFLAGILGTGLIPALDASKITTGTFATALIPALSALSGVLLTGQIPALDAAKIATGTFADGFLPSVGTLRDAIAQSMLGGVTTGYTNANVKSALLAIPGGNIASAIAAAIVPVLDASKITTGVFGTGLIPALDAAKIATGTFVQTLIPSLTGTWGGTIASGLLSGILGTGLIPALDASKITTGTLAAALIPALSALSGVLLTGQIPALDAAKIATGTFADGFLPSVGTLRDAIAQSMLGGATTGYTNANVKSALLAIPGGNIASAIAAAIVPALDASKITTGTLAAALIPALSALSGVLLTGQIPALDAAKITTGTFADGFLPGLGTLRDSIAQSMLGGVTTGYTAAQVKSALLAIPGANIASAIAAAIVPALDASKITTGVFGTGFIPALDAAKITTGTFVQTLIPSLTGTWGGSIASGLLSGVLGTGLIPALDASKITTGTFAAALIPALSALSGVLLTGQIPALDAAKIATGTFADGFLPSVGTLRDAIAQSMLGGATTGYTNANVKSALLAIPGGNIASAIAAAIVPALDASKITTGTFAAALIPALSALSGVLLTGQIPALDAAKIATGTFADAFLPGLGTLRDSIAQSMIGGSLTGYTAAQVKTALLAIPGVNIASAIAAAIVPALDASKITTGIFGTGFIPALDAAKITTGTFTTGLIPALDAAKITTGTFADGFLPSVGTLRDAIAQSILGGATTGYTNANVKSALLAIPGGNIASAIAAAIVPALDASKITTGTFAAGLIPALSALSGTLLTGQIPNLDAAKITTGTFIAGLIPSLDVSKITTGIFGAGFIPSLDASKITTGTFANAMSPGLLPQTLWQTGQVAAKNLVVSPDFEDPTIPRTTGSNGGGVFGYSTAAARSGTHSYSVQTGTGTNNDYFFLSPHTLGNEQTNPAAGATKVQPGQWFYAEIYVQAKATNTTTAGNVQLGAFLTDSTAVNSTIFPIFGAVTQSGLSSSAWTKVSGWYQIPAGYDRIAPIAWTNGANVTAQTFYFDDARVAEETWAQSVIQKLFGGSGILSAVLAAVVPALDASKITTGAFVTSLIPALDAAKITTGTFAAGLIPALSALSGTLLAGQIPGLDASKITTGVFGTGFIPALDAAKITTGTFVTGLIPALDAAKITTGTFAAGLIPALSALSGTLLAGQIPGLDASKITTGVFGTGFIPALDAAKITTGTFVTGLIPSLDAAKITTGTFADGFLPGLGTLRDSIAQSMLGGATTGYTAAQVKTALLAIPGANIASAIAAAIVPALDASKITTGIFGTGFIPNLAASKITSGTFTQGLIPSLSAAGGYGGTIESGFLTGVLGTGLIPSLDASKVTTGTFAAGLIPALSALTGTLLTGQIPALDAAKITTGTFADSFMPSVGTLRDAIAQSMLGGATTGYTNANVKSALLAIPGANIASAIAAAIVPALDASKITTGIFGTGFIPNLDAAKITTGTFVTGLIPSLDVSKIATGVFGAGFIPSLDASKITTGTLGTALIPNLAASKITSGTFLSTFFPMFGLQQTQSTNLVLDPSCESATAWAGTIAGGVSLSTDQAHSGTHSLKVVGPTAAYLSASDAGVNLIKTRPGEVFRVGAWIWPAAANAGTGQMLFDLNTYDAAGTFVSNTAGVNHATLTKGQWTYVEELLTVPAGIYGFYPLLWTPGVPSTDVYYFDDVLFREETQPQGIIRQLFGGSSILSSILAANVPSLDASKIATGTFAAGLIPALSALSGTLLAGQIPGLDAAKITTGTFVTGLIPALDVSKITTGVFGAGFIPSLDASKITTGQFTATMVASVMGGTDLGAELTTLGNGIVNAVNNTPGGTGVIASAIETTMAKIPTLINNAFGTVKTRASTDDASAVLGGLNSTVQSQGLAIQALQASLAGSTGVSISKALQAPALVTTSATGAFTDIFTSAAKPAWWTLGNDALSYIDVGGGAGGDGAGFGATGGAGGNATTTTLSGTGGSTISGAGGPNHYAPGGVIYGYGPGPVQYDDWSFPGGHDVTTYSAAGSPPGGGGSPGLGANRYGGGPGAWSAGAGPLKPAVGSTLTGTVGAGGNGGTGVGGNGGNGAHGAAYHLFRKALSADWLARSATITLGAGAIQLFRMQTGGISNTGATSGDAQTVSGIWSANPGGTGVGHVVFLRADSTMANLVYLLVTPAGADTSYELGCVTAGTRHVFQTGTLTGVTVPNDSFGLESDTARGYTVLVNDNPQFTYTDTGALSAAPASTLRFGGFGSSDSSVALKVSHGSLLQWALIDSGIPDKSLMRPATPAPSGTTITPPAATDSSCIATSYTSTLSGTGTDPLPSVTFTVPANGKIRVKISAEIWNASIAGMRMALTMSGANVLAASDRYSIQVTQEVTGHSASAGNTATREWIFGDSNPLNPGSTTFSVQIETTAGTAHFVDADIMVTPEP